MLLLLLLLRNENDAYPLAFVVQPYFGLTFILIKGMNKVQNKKVCI